MVDLKPNQFPPARQEQYPQPYPVVVNYQQQPVMGQPVIFAPVQPIIPMSPLIQNQEFLEGEIRRSQKCVNIILAFVAIIAIILFSLSRPKTIWYSDSYSLYVNTQLGYFYAADLVIGIILAIIGQNQLKKHGNHCIRICLPIWLILTTISAVCIAIIGLINIRDIGNYQSMGFSDWEIVQIRNALIRAKVVMSFFLIEGFVNVIFVCVWLKFADKCRQLKELTMVPGYLPVVNA